MASIVDRVRVWSLSTDLEGRVGRGTRAGWS
jgi:hypothetical protein